MSVKGLANTSVRVYSVHTTQDAYGANVETYTLKYGVTKVRVRMLKPNYENITDGKEMSINKYRIYFPYQYAIVQTDLIVDFKRGRKYDVLYVNRMDRKKHLEVDVKRVESIRDYLPLSSTSSFDFTSSSSSSSYQNCPNNIYSWNGSVYEI